MDSNYWKDRYKDSWDKAAQKEKMVIELIEAHTGKKVELYGLGAGTTDYITGSAQQNNSAKGDADLYLKDSEIFLEVTGPNIKVLPQDSFWIRPDKISNALTKIENGISKGTYVIHIIERKDVQDTLIRVIPITHELTQFPTIKPTIHGTIETYIEIPSNYQGAMSIKDFIELIKSS
ncbi:hypothetical protein [Flavobacterium sp. CAU 1735]|uniref:hypothetical protein n=1 Tax=Flavobacterium sp. CAU 1735 TaxID=3140361 RepID=UPI0032614DCB